MRLAPSRRSRARPWALALLMRHHRPERALEREERS